MPDSTRNSSRVCDLGQKSRSAMPPAGAADIGAGSWRPARRPAALPASSGRDHVIAQGGVRRRELIASWAKQGERSVCGCMRVDVSNLGLTGQSTSAGWSEALYNTTQHIIANIVWITLHCIDIADYNMVN
ncbi:uncharacterized protein CIMG_05575 [Coccidioides immitis RS]|uniref:Uncharacterized protein n=2 Tax=Coccidioides immitis TaxID=5501 RepID=J3KFW3_COCIM|nr:uncharacterized protein CIMG_05575 [Coccidioides immitis RS]EAS34551.3 hypothetical protein CIMG_05575 [Coccidioides immitis RS]KMU74444.1 hypothetical protein CISG_04515 [Coccidioides immitis RMSCC 3703]